LIGESGQLGDILNDGRADGHSCKGHHAPPVSLRIRTIVSPPVTAAYQNNGYILLYITQYFACSAQRCGQSARSVV
jgi:hypothetical protein